jgi:hypothetical protein
MDRFSTQSIHIIGVLIIIDLITPTFSSAQIGIQPPVYDVNSYSDSIRFSFPKPILPLRNWQDPIEQYFEIMHDDNKLDINHYISPNFIPKDPFKLDTRSSSYYVPRMVRDELNLIMNRPRDNAFLPILPVAFLAIQLASQYLIVQQKTEITVTDVKNAEEGYPILEELWKKNPQTLSELYQSDSLQDKYSMLELQRLMGILVDNKLVKRKLVEKSETQFFYALEKMRYDQLAEQVKIEKYESADTTRFP